MSVFDSILILDNINESDDRSYARKSYVGVDSGPGGMVGRDDPKMYANNNFGRVLNTKSRLRFQNLICGRAANSKNR